MSNHSGSNRPERLPEKRRRLAQKKRHYWHDLGADIWHEKAAFTEGEALAAAANLLALTGQEYRACFCWCERWHIRMHSQTARIVAAALRAAA